MTVTETLITAYFTEIKEKHVKFSLIRYSCESFLESVFIGRFDYRVVSKFLFNFLYIRLLYIIYPRDI